MPFSTYVSPCCGLLVVFVGPSKQGCLRKEKLEGKTLKEHFGASLKAEVRWKAQDMKLFMVQEYSCDTTTYYYCTLFENYSRCRIWIFQQFLSDKKLTCLVTLFDRKLRIFKNSPKWTIFGIFNKLLSTQNANVARFARNVEWDFFCDFQTPWHTMLKETCGESMSCWSIKEEVLLKRRSLSCLLWIRWVPRLAHVYLNTTERFKSSVIPKWAAENWDCYTT